MSKRAAGTTKKGLPKDLQRITNGNGKRVWITGGREFPTLADVRFALSAAK